MYGRSDIRTEKSNPIDYYLSLAIEGDFPLFYREWISSSLTNSERGQKEQSKLLKKYFKKIEKHKTLAKKRTAISAMTNKEREEFITAFFINLEEKILDREHKYH